MIDFACVNSFILWKINYPNWQQKKNHQTSPAAISRTRNRKSKLRSADSGNFKKHYSQCNNSYGSLLGEVGT
jgi:hypothetical protein